METLLTVAYIVLGVLLFSLAIAIHEFGHFIVALRLGLKVERFSIGFGPAIWKRTWRGVEYRISWIPLGGYVSIPDVDPEGTKALEGAKASGDAAPKAEIPVWKEILVAVAGPAMNLVLAVVLAVVLSLVPSAKFGQLPTEIGGFLPDSPAEAAGMRKGDVVMSVGGHPVSTWNELLTEVQITGGRPTEFKIRRAMPGGDGTSFNVENLAFTVTPGRSEVTGAYLISALSVTNATGAVAWMPARNPLKQLAWDAGGIFRVLKALVTPKEAAATGKALGGPVMMAEGIYRTLRHDVCDGIGFLRFLNVNLAILNLLPIPVLDGGLIMFALIALVFRRRLPEKFVSVITSAFMYLLLVLMAYLIVNDSWRSFKIHRHNAELAAEAEQSAGETGEKGAEDGDVE